MNKQDGAYPIVLPILVGVHCDQMQEPFIRKLEEVFEVQKAITVDDFFALLERASKRVLVAVADRGAQQLVDSPSPTTKHRRSQEEALFAPLSRPLIERWDQGPWCVSGKTSLLFVDLNRLYTMINLPGTNERFRRYAFDRMRTLPQEILTQAISMAIWGYLERQGFSSSRMLDLLRESQRAIIDALTASLRERERALLNREFALAFAPITEAEQVFMDKASSSVEEPIPPATVDKTIYGC